MASEASSTKSWFLHIGGQPQGPFAVDQIAAKYREGVISRDTHIWREGMAAWSTLKDIPEVSSALSGEPVAAPALPPMPSLPPATPSSAQELSHLIELNPKDVDDRTSAIDPKQLKSAKRLAAAALKVAGSAEKKAYASGNSAVGIGASGSGSRKNILILVIALPLLACAGIGAAIALKAITLEQLKADASRLISQLTSSLPPLEDVSATQYEALRAAASADVENGGPKAAIAISSVGVEKPVFYVASNLPDGTNLSFGLKADPDNVLSEQPVEIRFPLVVSKHLARSKPLHTAEGGLFPPGDYIATVVADEEQGAQAKAILAKSKLMTSQRFFLGGAPGAGKDAAFTSKLEQFHQKQHEKSLAEYKQGVLLVFKLETGLAMSAEAMAKISKTTGKPQRALWADFDAKWPASNVEPLEKGSNFSDVFAAIHEIWADGKKIHDTGQAAVLGSVPAGLAWQQVTALQAQAAQTVAAVKARLDAISKSLK